MLREERREWGGLSVVEDFYGAPLDASLIKHISHTPTDQLVELSLRIVARRSQIEAQLLGRNNWSPYDRDFHPSLEPSTRASVRPSNATAPPSLLVDEGLYFGTQNTFSSLDQSRLKHWVLYSEQLALPDSIFYWAEHLVDELHAVGEKLLDEHRQQRRLTAWASWVAPMRPLVEVGAIRLIPDREALRPIRNIGDHPAPLLSREHLSYTTLAALLIEDPVLSPTVRELTSFPTWEFTSQDGDPDEIYDLLSRLENEPALHERIPAILRRAYPSVFDNSLDAGALRATPPEEWLHALGMSTLLRLMDIVPATSSQLSRSHLLSVSAAVFEDAPPDLNALATRAVEYEMPSLSDVGINDLVRLRQDDEIFGALRETLSTLTVTIMQNKSTTIPDFQLAVREAAVDIVGPTYDRLTAQVRRGSFFAKAAGVGVSVAVKLGLDGLATVLGAPPSPPTHGVTTAAGRITGRKVEQRLSSREDARRVARTILLSTLPADYGAV